MCRCLLSLACLTVLVARARTESPSFTNPPAVERLGAEVKIYFALKSASDVEVAILDARGKIVRHLAAGVLGGKSPAPLPLQPGLSQSLRWDGKDDLGKEATGGPFEIRLRAGTQIRFGRMIGGSPSTGSVVGMPYRAYVNGLVAGRDGQLLVKMMSAVGSHGNSGLWPWHLRQFDRNGDYVRTLLPYPPSTPPEKATGFQLLNTPNTFTPANRTSLYPVFWSLGNELLPRLVDDQIVFVHSEKRQLNLLSLDGTNRLRTIPMWPEKSKLVCPIWLDIQVAFSPDGRYVYYSNVAGTAYDGKSPADIHPDWPQGRIYRQDLTGDGEPERFFDLTLPAWDKQKFWMPSAWDKKTAAAGVDTDTKGNVLVCDLVNQEIVEISPEGKLQSRTRAPWPDRVLVSRKTGDLYVLSRKVSRGFVPAATLRKISGRGDTARTVAELPLQGSIGGAFTLDESGPRPLIWLAGQRRENDPDSTQLVRVEDRGEELLASDKEFLNRDKNAIGFVGYMTVDREADLVYVTRSGGKVWRYDGKTGEGGLLSLRAVDLAIGPGGHIYTWGTEGGYQGPVARFRRDLAPAPLEATGKHTFGYLYGRAGRGSSVCGLDVDSQGRVYATFGSNDCHVRVYGSDGELVRYPRSVKISEGKKEDVPAAITGVTGYGGSIRVDSQGNIYLVQQGLPKGHRPPPGFEKDEAYATSEGTIYKFPPTGGEVITKNGSVQKVVGSLAEYPGCSPVSRWNAVGSCACTKPRFDVDPFGRLYIPDGITFSASVRDNAGNEIARFGSYGNFDCQGPGSKEPVPAIPLGWPVAVAASEKFIYVGDCLNHRVVRLDRSHVVEKTLKVP